MRLGGSVFARNAIKYDYCIIEAIESLLPVCDKVVVLECNSEDETALMLKKRYSTSLKVNLILGQEWNVAKDYNRLTILANEARKMLHTDWHFMIQADEVLHESSYPYILDAIANEESNSFRCRRYNMFGNLDHYIDFNSERKPCGDNIVRLARTNI